MYVQYLQTHILYIHTILLSEVLAMYVYIFKLTVTHMLYIHTIPSQLLSELSLIAMYVHIIPSN